MNKKRSVRRAWQVFKQDPFHPSLRSHETGALSARAKHTVYSAVTEADLRVLFRIDGDWVTSLDGGKYKIYRD